MREDKENMKKVEKKTKQISRNQPQISHSFVDELDFKDFPFKTSFSLEPLVDFWKQLHDTESSISTFASEILARLADNSDLLTSITNSEDVYKKNQDLIDLMMSAVVPKATSNCEMVAVVPPFSNQTFFHTEAFGKQLLDKMGCYNDQLNLLDDEIRLYIQVLYAYYYVICGVPEYQIDLDFDDYSAIYTKQEPKTGLTHHYRLEWDAQFCQIKVIGDPKPLSPLITKNLLSNLSGVSILKDSVLRSEDAIGGQNAALANVTALKLLIELLPPSNFEFHGFMVIRATEITCQHVLGKITQDLLERDSIDSSDRFIGIQQMLRTLLRVADVEASLIGIDATDQVLMINSGGAENNTLFSHVSDLEGSQYQRALDKGGLWVVPDLAKGTRRKRTTIEENMLDQGVASLAIIPLQDPEDNRDIGLLELRSSTKNALNDMNAMRLYELGTAFSSAVKRWVTERADAVERTIRQQCTPIHQSVAWRFEKAARSFIDRKRVEPKVSEMEPIVFHNVYPLYGQSDIRGSSELQNAATQADLTDQLTLAGEILDLARDIKPMPFLDDLLYRIEIQLNNLQGNLGAGSDVQVLDFLHQDVEQCFDTLDSFKNYDAGISRKIEHYRSSLDPQRRSIHRQRKEYDESINLINDTISAYIDREQETAQCIFPHYFEKNVTDGVDHQIYIGASMLDKQKFDLIYLKNLRLWQLMVLCGSAYLTEQLKPDLNLKLDTAHLVAVQETAQTISFDYNEKQLAMKGSYDVRYEIMKKRIDKAKIKNSGDRLTQPGKIAIVYSQTREGSEYEKYLEYLLAKEYLIDNIERLDLEDLQGLYSLKALRVSVNLSRPVELPRPEENLSFL